MGGDGGVPDQGPPPADLARGDMALGPPPQGMLITVPQDAWTWVDFPDSYCDDGTTTGIGVYNSSKSQNLIVFMNGGGACWDYQTCYVLNTAAHGPFQKTQFDASVAGTSMTGTIFDRTDANNPFKDWSMVFIPYCTGDVHSGNNVATYMDNSNPPVVHMYHHVGHANVLAFLKRLGPTFPNPTKLVVSGASAGGFGSFLNYYFFRWYWPNVESYLLDDSGPPLEMGDIPPGFITSWIDSWKLDQVINQTCGSPCLDDFSQGVPALASAFPNDRMALLESQQDKVISGYFLLSGVGFQTALTNMLNDRIAPTTNFKYFVVTGNTHTMLGNLPMFTSNGVMLETWLGQMINDQKVWTSTMP
jgi:hypothetical protein